MSETFVKTPGWAQHARDATGRFIDGYLTRQIADDMRQGCPVKTGALHRSIREVGNKIFVGTDHWHYVEYGTPAHIIRPVVAKALRWESADGVHFAKVVHHPGTRENPFIRTAFYKYRPGAGIRAGL